MKITLVLALGLSLGIQGTSSGIPYLYGEMPLPEGALMGLSARAQTEGIPLATADVTGVLSFVGVSSEEELLGSDAFLFTDGEFFLLGVQTEGAKAFLRGNANSAEVIAIGDHAILGELLSLIGRLGLLPEKFQVELCERTFPEKLPAPPEGVRLDPVLWGLLIHPDWFAFAEEKGIERVGLRVRVVAEVKGLLPEHYEPYIQSSSDGLVQLLLPIPLLDDLAGEGVVVRVRPPYIPHPLVPERP